MRSAVCSSANASTKEECDALLNLQEWTMQNFIKRYMTGTMPELVAEQLRAPSLGIAEALRNASASITEADENAFLWTGTGWVACSQYNTTCYGTISKSEWYSRETRGASCNRVFAEEVRKGNVNSTAVGLDICNLNSRTNALCEKLKAAQVHTHTHCLLFPLVVCRTRRRKCALQVLDGSPDAELVLAWYLHWRHGSKHAVHAIGQLHEGSTTCCHISLDSEGM